MSERMTDEQIIKIADELKNNPAVDLSSHDTYAAAQAITQLRTDLAAANAIIERLPKTADGVPVVPGMVLYELQDYWMDDPEIREVDGVMMRIFPASAIIEECYSTHEAAEAAREGGEG